MFAFEGDRRRCVAMPLGGVGTGNLAIHADGSLRQWQIHNQINHGGYLPYSFFALDWRGQGTWGGRVLQTKEFWDEPEFEPAKTATDHVVPPEMIRTLGGLEFARTTVARAAYPVMEVDYELDGPLEVRLTAWSPLVQENADDSGWPVAVFEFDLTSNAEHPLTITLMSALQNAVGWNGAYPIRGIEVEGYGGNFNLPTPEGVALRCADLPEDHPHQGVMLHAGVGGKLFRCPQWTDLDRLWTQLRKGDLTPSGDVSTSAKGRTVNSAIAQRVELAPGETRRVTFVIAWHFPNRYVDWSQWESLIPAGRSRFYLGNHYAHRGDPTFWIGDFLGRLPELREKTYAYRDAVYADLPAEIADAAGSSVANLRTNVCLWTEDGRFYGFEGGHGASTWDTVGGCCPMNCTHVWNYEQGLVELWPELFRTMRESDWNLNLAPDGQLPHRITLPVYVRKLWDTPIGGPENPALDGVFAAVLKTLQYGLHDGEWAKRVYPQVERAMGWVMRHSDRGDGLIEGEQPNTYDIHLYGPNTFIGSQYLAALLAMARLAEMAGADPSPYRARFETGSRAYDETCWNGEYYVQRVPEGCDKPYQFGEGCVADQLLGQWWAHHLDLGYVLPPDRVRAATAAVFRRNFRHDFYDFKQEPRVFASDHDRGLLIATYEPGQRAQVPLLYSDEVWTGIEYAFAALCLYEGLVDEGLEVVRAARGRYDGRQRNPFNEMECGDHYIRALSAWSLPKAWTVAQASRLRGSHRESPPPQE
jgi:uncharacterized protein (DUF608 family)